MHRVEIFQPLLSLTERIPEEESNFNTIKITKQHLIQFAKQRRDLSTFHQFTENDFYGFCRFMGVRNDEKPLVLHAKGEAGVLLCQILSRLTLTQLRLIIFEGDIYGTVESYYSSFSNLLFTKKCEYQKTGLSLPDYIPIVFIKTNADTKNSYAKTDNLIQELKAKRSNDVYVLKPLQVYLLKSIYQKYNLENNEIETASILAQLSQTQIVASQYKYFWKYHLPINEIGLEQGGFTRLGFLQNVRTIYGKNSPLDDMHLYFQNKATVHALTLNIDEKAINIVSLPKRDYEEAFGAINEYYNEELIAILELYFFYFYADIRYITNPELRTQLNPLTVFDTQMIISKKNYIPITAETKSSSDYDSHNYKIVSGVFKKLNEPLLEDGFGLYGIFQSLICVANVKYFAFFYSYFLACLLDKIEINPCTQNTIYKFLEAKEEIRPSEVKLLETLPLNQQRKLFTALLSKSIDIKTYGKLLYSAECFIPVLSFQQIRHLLNIIDITLQKPKANQLIKNFDDINHYIDLLCKIRGLIKTKIETTQRTKSQNTLDKWLGLLQEISTTLHNELYYLLSSLQTGKTIYFYNTNPNYQPWHIFLDAKSLAYEIPLINTQGIAIFFNNSNAKDRNGIIDFYLDIKNHGAKRGTDYQKERNFFPRTMLAGLVELLPYASEAQRARILPVVLSYLPVDKPFPLHYRGVSLVHASYDLLLKSLACPLSRKSNNKDLDCIIHYLQTFSFQKINFLKLQYFLIRQAQLLNASIVYSSAKAKQKVSAVVLNMYEYLFDKSSSLLKNLNEDAFNFCIHIAESIPVNDQIRWLSLLSDIKAWHGDNPVFEHAYKTIYAALQNNYAQEALSELPEHVKDTVATYICSP